MKSKKNSHTNKYWMVVLEVLTDPKEILVASHLDHPSQVWFQKCLKTKQLKHVETITQHRLSWKMKCEMGIFGILPCKASGLVNGQVFPRNRADVAVANAINLPIWGWADTIPPYPTHLCHVGDWFMASGFPLQVSNLVQALFSGVQIGSLKGCWAPSPAVTAGYIVCSVMTGDDWQWVSRPSSLQSQTNQFVKLVTCPEDPSRFSTSPPSAQFLEEEFLIIRQLDHQWYIKGLLQPFGKEKGHQVSQMQRLGGWPSTRVDVEFFALPGDQRAKYLEDCTTYCNDSWFMTLAEKSHKWGVIPVRSRL